MRVTSNTYSDTLANYLQRISQRQVSLQSQISSGQRVQNPDDDPLAAGQVLNLRADSASVQQYQKNIQTHSEFAKVSLGTMRSLQKVLNRAQEIAVSADDVDSRDNLRSYATELNQLINQAVQFANASHRGEHVFGGTRSDLPPFSPALDDQGRIVSVAFSGNTTVSQSEIAQGVLISSRVPGENTTGTGERGLLTDSRYGADFFAHLIALRDNLENGDVQAIINTSRPDLQKDEDNLIHHLADNASLQSRLDATLSSAKEEKLAIEGEISRRTDVDLADTIVKLNQNQTNYQAALQSAGTILNLTLLDFLH